MKIAYVCGDRGIPLGSAKGGAVHVQATVEALRALGHDVDVVAASVTRDTPAAATVTVAPPPLLDMIDDGTEPRVPRALAHVLSNVAMHDALCAELVRARPDIIYERLSPFGIAGSVVARRLQIPHVLEVNALLAEEGVRFRKQALGDAATYLEHSALRAATAVVVVSRTLADRVCELGVEARRVTVLPNGVDQRRFAPEGAVATGLPRDRTIVGFVGSLKPWHGVEILLEACERLADDQRYHLLIVGDGPAARALQRVAERSPGRITWIRGVAHEDVASYIRAMDIAVAPYPPVEPFYFSPLKVLEYMAAGRAVVASRIGQIAELIRHGETGWLVEPGDAAMLAAAIRDLGQDDAARRALGRNAAAEIAERHLWSHRAADLTALFHSLMAPSCQPARISA